MPTGPARTQPWRPEPLLLPRHSSSRNAGQPEGGTDDRRRGRLGVDFATSDGVILVAQHQWHGSRWHWVLLVLPLATAAAGVRPTCGLMFCAILAPSWPRRAMP